MRVSALVVLLASCMCVASVQAGSYTFPATGPAAFTIMFPDDWTVNLDQNLLRATPAGDTTAYVGVWALKDTDSSDPDAVAEDAWQDVEDAVATEVTGLEIPAPTRSVMNGIPFFSAQGQGHDASSGEMLDLTVSLFIPDGKTLCLMTCGGNPDDAKKYSDHFEAIMQSIRKPAVQSP